jgi:lipopolysaccharide cholinephosphotransferase
MLYNKIKTKKYISLTIIIILLVIISALSFELYYKKKYLKICQENSDKVIDYLEIVQTDRLKSMNGIDDKTDKNKKREIVKNSIDFSFHYLLFNLFSNFIKELDANKIDYFLIGGSLIGYFRHNQGFIPWDDDIDIGILEKDKEKVYKIIENMHHKNNKFNLKKDFVDKIIYGEFNDNPIQVDLFYYKYFDNETYYNFENPKQRLFWPGQHIYSNEIFPLQNVLFKLYLPDGNVYDQINVKIPYKSIEYLDRCYPKWQNEKKYQTPHVSYYQVLSKL